MYQFNYPIISIIQQFKDKSIRKKKINGDLRVNFKIKRSVRVYGGCIRV